jgi:hypothetical protein
MRVPGMGVIDEIGTFTSQMLSFDGIESQFSALKYLPNSVYRGFWLILTQSSLLG